MISEQTERLSHLVETLLELTELDTVKQCDQISLAALIEEVICDLTQIAEEKQNYTNPGTRRSRADCQ